MTILNPYVQRVASGSPTSDKWTLSASTKQGNVLIAAITGGAGIVPTALTDSKGNTWVKATATGANRSIAVFVAVMKTALLSGDQITANVNGSNPMAVVDEYTTLMGTYPLDRANSTNNASNVTSLASGTTGQLIRANQLIYTAVALNTPTPTAVVPTGYTDRGSATDGVVYIQGAELIVNSNAALNPTWNWTTATNGSVAVATFMLANPPLPGNYQQVSADDNGNGVLSVGEKIR